MINLNFLSVTITTDEESSFYQCNVTMKDTKDYFRFPRDTPFIVHLFNIDYHFIIDSRTLNRDIDEEGNYNEICSFSGLSPLAKYAVPRCTKITKTWETTEYASVIVEELIGPVNWQLIDWPIAAYRLAAEDAAPLDIALQIVNAVGGLIESQPDGSVVCRHRWPVSIKDFNTVLPDHILYENMILSLTEDPTNDTLIDSIRILDQDASYQDRMEYIPNILDSGEDDPFNGILYAFPSPWRENLRMVTTRFNAIRLGKSSEGTRIISDVNPDFPSEIISFINGQSSTTYPIMSLTTFEWLDENLGSVVVSSYSTSLTATMPGSYHGHSLAKVSYVTRYIAIPVSCVNQDEPIRAQFLLLELQNG